MQDTPNLVQLLKAAELFMGLTDEQLRRLAAISQELTYNKGDVIFPQGGEGDSLYVIRKGQVEITVSDAGGRARSEVYLGQGQVFGEMALIDYGKRSATVRCVRDGTVVDMISRDNFTDLCNADKAIGYIVMRNLAIDLSFKLRHRNLDPNAE